MRAGHRILAVAALPLWFAAVGGAVEHAVCQVPDTTQPGRAVVIGRVADTAGGRMAGVDVIVSRERDSALVATGVTDTSGTARLLAVPEGGPYTILVRKMGYAPLRTNGVSLRGGEALELSFVLQPRVVVLPEVATVGDQRNVFVPKLVRRGGFLGIRLLGCLYIGFAFFDTDIVQETEGIVDGCTATRRRREAQRAAKQRVRMAKELEREMARRAERMTRLLEEAEGRFVAGVVRDAARHVDSAVSAGRQPDSTDVLVLRDAVQVCRVERKPADETLCREILKRTKGEKLDRLTVLLASLDRAGPVQRDTTPAGVSRQRVSPTLPPAAEPAARPLVLKPTSATR